jgi:uncharacterized protein DUF4329
MRVLPIVILLAACVPEDLATVQMTPRAVPQSPTEIAFVSGLLNEIQPASIADDREYCGLIGVDANGTLTATSPRRGRVSSCLPPAPITVGFTVIASYHTHGSSSLEYLTEIPSFDDMRTDIEDDTDGYIATPGGRMWYVDARRRVARQICGLNCLVPDPNHREDPNFPVRKTYTLDQLRAY